MVKKRIRRNRRMRKFINTCENIGLVLIILAIISVFGIAGAVDTNPEYEYIIPMVKTAVTGLFGGLLYYFPRYL